MGTNFPAFLREANRVIRPGGKLFVAEVVSRFPDSDCKSFIKCMKEQAGFQILKVAKLKDFFFVMVFEKEKRKLGPV
jgi:ribosomal RNA-processing protein 8